MIPRAPLRGGILLPYNLRFRVIFRFAKLRAVGFGASVLSKVAMVLLSDAGKLWLGQRSRYDMLLPCVAAAGVRASWKWRVAAAKRHTSLTASRRMAATLLWMPLMRWPLRGQEELKSSYGLPCGVELLDVAKTSRILQWRALGSAACSAHCSPTGISGILASGHSDAKSGALASMGSTFISELFT